MPSEPEICCYRDGNQRTEGMLAIEFSSEPILRCSQIDRSRSRRFVSVQWPWGKSRGAGKSAWTSRRTISIRCVCGAGVSSRCPGDFFAAAGRAGAISDISAAGARLRPAACTVWRVPTAVRWFPDRSPSRPDVRPARPFLAKSELRSSRKPFGQVDPLQL